MDLVIVESDYSGTALKVLGLILRLGTIFLPTSRWFRIFENTYNFAVSSVDEITFSAIDLALPLNLIFAKSPSTLFINTTPAECSSLAAVSVPL